MDSIQLLGLRRVRTTGEIWDSEFRPGLNLLVGEENTSKTTTLRIFDFCLGDDQTASYRFGNAIADEYQAFILRVRMAGKEHTLTRDLHTRGQTTRVDVDGQTMDTAAFNQWVNDLMGWPRILIPRGRSVTAATQEDPLTFRGLFRHIYRRADSWTSFASQEFEYWRRAVTAFFLSVAGEMYRGGEVEVAKLEGQIRDLEERRRTLREMLDDVIRRAADGYHQVDAVNFDSVEFILNQLADEIVEVQHDRERLATQVRSDLRYDSSQDERLAALDASLQQATGDLADLDQLLGEQNRLLVTLDGDVQRIERALHAHALLGSIVVTACPACHQPIRRSGDDGDWQSECYVCHQSLGHDPDARQRRLELEERAVRQERSELAEVVAKVQRRLEEAQARRLNIEAERNKLLHTIDQDRRAMVAPLLQDFERLQHRLGQLEQRRQTLARLGELRDLVGKLESERLAVEERLDQLRVALAQHQPNRGLILERTSALARHMNEFISRLPTPEGIGGPVTVDPTDLGFYVGRESWENALGNERRVLFLLAYHYGLLRLAAEGQSLYPGLVVLDNPFQQDVPDAVVIRGLELFAECCRSSDGLQVIVATRRELPNLTAHRIYFEQVFNPDPDQP